MREFNAIIIDDEVNVQQTLEILIEQYCPELNLIGKACSAEEGRQLLMEKPVHVIFLDISMPNENGFEFIASIKKGNYAIIFTTAHEEYALKAIKASAIDYLLKPVDAHELKEAVIKATTYQELRRQKNELKSIYKESLENLTEYFRNGDQQVKKITIGDKFGFRVVEVDLIRYLEADSNYTIVHLTGFDKVISCRTLAEFERVLDPAVFFRGHKSNIVNLNYVKGFTTYEGNFIILDDDTKLSISRRRYLEFRDALNLLSKPLDL